MVTAVGVVFGTSFLLLLSQHLNLMMIFQGMGILTITVGVFLIFGIKDVVSSKKKDDQITEETARDSLPSQ